jgi:hypothetical protein
LELSSADEQPKEEENQQNDDHRCYSDSGFCTRAESIAAG